MDISVGQTFDRASTMPRRMPSNRKKTRKVDGEDKEMKEEKKRYNYWPLTEKTREQVEDIVLKWDTQGLISITQTTSNSNEACWGIVCNACALHANKTQGLIRQIFDWRQGNTG